MRILIDIPEEVKDNFVNNFAWGSQKCVDARIIENEIMIPDNPTNGDMIKAMFPNVIYQEGFLYQIVNGKQYIFLSVSEYWWNAPYKQKEDFEWAGEGD